MSNQDKEVALLCCPLCGRPPKAWYSEDTSRHVIRCIGGGHHIYADGRTFEDARAVWNTRFSKGIKDDTE